MPKAAARDGIFTRKDRPGAFYGSWVDASGKRRKRKFAAPTLQQARMLLNAEKSRVDEQKTKGYAAPAPESFASLVPRYLREQKSNLTPASMVRSKGIIERHLMPVFGQMQVGNIRRTDVLKYIAARSAKVSPASVSKETNVLKHILGQAVEWELIPVSPAQKVKNPDAPAGRLRYLQPTELRAVLAECPDWLRPIAGLAAFTGMRRSEILGLRWLSVDLNGSRLLLSQTKNGEGRIVPLNQLALEVLRGQWSTSVKPTARVFAIADRTTADNISKGFAAVCRRLEIHDFSFHDLRHTAASWLRMQGADIHTVATILGHKDLRMATRYQHLSSGFLSEAVGRLDSIFGEAPQLASGDAQ